MGSMEHHHRFAAHQEEAVTFSPAQELHLLVPLAVIGLERERQPPVDVHGPTLARWGRADRRRGTGRVSGGGTGSANAVPRWLCPVRSTERATVPATFPTARATPVNLSTLCSLP